jgi:pSer/pThr/pTyr-binding forkhead associated (FHA) protein
VTEHQPVHRPALNRVVLGTDPESDVLVADPYVSSRHATIYRDPHNSARVLVEDLGSLNGTFVNNRRVYAPTRLYPGDRLRLGHTEVQVPAELFVTVA